MKPWELNLQFHETRLEECGFWVQFHGLPLEGFSESNAVKLGGKVGKVMAFENHVEEGKIGRSFIRVRVSSNLKKPLIEGV